jgi:Family of unknown function (DUF6064)
MSEWWTYSLTDFLLFSSRTYHRLFAHYNESVWPAHIAVLALALAVLVLVRRASENATRAITAILAGLWLWVAWAFHLERYATINWAALYLAAAFAVQALLLLWHAFVARPAVMQADTLPARAGLAIFLFALLAQPGIAILFGRDWRQSEIFGLAPDPTAVATLGLLCLSARIPWLLFPIPLSWCAVTGLTLWAMEAPDALVAPIAGALALLVAAWKTAAQ